MTVILSFLKVDLILSVMPSPFINNNKQLLNNSASCFTKTSSNIGLFSWNQSCQSQPLCLYNSIFKMNQQTISSYKTALAKHQTFLKKFKIFPDKSRKAIYVQLLQLPLNHNHFIELTKPYPLLPEHSVDKQVSFIVSAFVKLYPDLGNQWLPGLIHPFVKLFKEDAIAGFEIALTFLVNWFRPIFEDYPNSSKKIMSFFSRQLRNLQKKVNGYDYPLSAIIQPLLLVGLTDILNKDNTLQIYDYLAAHPFSPELYLCITSTILSKVQDRLCMLESIEDIALVLRKEKNLNIEAIVQEAVQLCSKEEEELSLIYKGTIFPLSKGRYPVCEFVKQVYKPVNRKLDKTQQEEMNRLKGKYQKLEGLVKSKLKQGIFTNSHDINKRYTEIEGQMREYLNQVREEHRKKLLALKEMEDQYKSKINNQNQDRSNQYEKEIEAIEKRGRLQRQILLMQEEAKSIREAEKAMIRRIEEVTKMKKEQLTHQNAQLRYDQRRIH